MQIILRKRLFVNKSFAFATKSEIFKPKEKEIIFQIPRGKARRPYDINIGQNIHNFTVNNIENLKDFSLTAYKLDHISGAKYLHFDTPELTNYFSFILNTENILPGKLFNEVL